MADNNIYGVDFIARCMAGEALDKAGQKSWTLVAGNNINILSDEEEKTETISATYEVDDALSPTSTNPVENRVIYDALQNVEIDVDNALSTTSENPVQNKVITAALKTKPTSVLPDGTVINDQKIMALTRAQYNAIQSKDPNTYYMITDDPVPEGPVVVRTGYKSVLDDYTSSYDANGNWVLTFQPEVSFEKLDVYLQWHFDWSAGTDWPLRTSTRSIILSLTKDVAGPVVSQGMNVYLANSASQAENPNANLLYDVLVGSVNVNYDAQTNTVTMLVAKPIMDAVYDANHDKNNIPVVMTNCVANAFGYVAYGPDTINVTTGLTAGTGIDMTNDVISIDMPVGSEIDMVVDPATYELTVTLYDQDTIPISTATVDLPLESMVVSGTYDDTTKSVILTLQNGQTISFSVADLVSGLETSAHAAATYQTQAGMSAYETSAHASSTYQTQAGMSAYLTSTDAAQTYQPIGSYATQSDISDMATETWVGQQGYLTSADEVPSVTSSDDGKVLKATYSGGVGSYSWQNAPSGLPVSTSADKGKVLTVNNQGNAAWDFVSITGASYGSVYYGNESSVFEPGPILQNPNDMDMDGSYNTNATDGDVLTWDATDSMMKWKAPAAGGLQVETDGTNYWITVNGIRLYFASSAPTGNIPAGSLGIGW